MMGSNHWNSRIDPAPATYVQREMGCAYSMESADHSAHGQANKNMSALSMHMALQKHWQDIPGDTKLSPDQI
eukprot:11764764-Ditylum_brightwellii.AAC.1